MCSIDLDWTECSVDYDRLIFINFISIQFASAFQVLNPDLYGKDD